MKNHKVYARLKTDKARECLKQFDYEFEEVEDSFLLENSNEVVVYELDETYGVDEYKQLFNTDNFFLFIGTGQPIETLINMSNKYVFNILSCDTCRNAAVMSLVNMFRFKDKYVKLFEEHNKLQDTVFELAFATTDVLAQNEFLEMMANKDGLTMLYNHSYFKEKLLNEFQRAKRYGSKFSLSLLDLDFFKLVNDRHGHLKGDEVLKAFAKIIEETVRTTDVAARYGGEEFGIIFAETSLKSAVAAVERIREQFNRIIFVNEDGQDFQCSFSAGVTEYRDGFCTSEEMLDTADKALYKSKENGRNQSTTF